LSLSTPPTETPSPADTGVFPTEPARTPIRALIREVIETILLTVIIYTVVNFATGRFRVEGDSMQPSLHPDQYVLVEKISYRLGNPQRGDVVVFQFPLAQERDFIKRIIGLPGETVSIVEGVVTINGIPLEEPYIAAPPSYSNTWSLGPDQYFVLGDNRNNSHDSHNWGPLDRKHLIGKAVFVYWPPEGWGPVPHYVYASAP
jgi:signal peptidase I